MSSMPGSASPQVPGDYASFYRRSVEQPEAFWREQAALIEWQTPFQQVCDYSRPPFAKWFVGGTTNLCHNAVDRHARDRGDQNALIWVSTEVKEERIYSFRELQREVERMAAILQAQGVGKGDRVLIYMPMIAEAAFAMLACARIGAIHSVVFGGFAAAELAKRIEDAAPKVIVCASCGLEPGRVVAYKPMVDQAIELSAHKPQSCLVFQRPQAAAAMQPGRDHDFAAAEAAAAPADPVPVPATDPLYILYTSGTTGKPKGVVRDNGGHAVALLNSMRMIYGVEAGDVYWSASDVGWVVGHSYIVYAPLLAGCTSVMYEGKPVGTPDAGAFWRVCAQHGVRALFTAPTALRAIKQQDPDGKLRAGHDLSKLHTLFLAGERCDPPTAIWAAERPIEAIAALIP